MLIDQSKVRECIAALLLDSVNPNRNPDMSVVMKTVEWVLLDECMIHSRGNYTYAAKVLGLDRGTVKRRYERFLKEKSI
ncbi:DNA binding HTH domain-containing protein [Vibrio crassostreae]|jgi:DNA-binding protein Fis|nr:DNA-binding protein Fis [Vibrio crassostreae]CAK2454680.1 DNA binding HTH domain-containing protein [Vibrio crassostreae]CAK2594448.1 DNA binding HTH domain-containing protein [Vibrio crassostreae]CAK2594997.1 DNA binding HTH domain-containing protein [Vibrio crassostreae]CAK2611187.1 DNA binding HTH domain-containing protein [Vibrio crassostreae]